MGTVALMTSKEREDYGSFVILMIFV